MAYPKVNYPQPLAHDPTLENAEQYRIIRSVAHEVYATAEMLENAAHKGRDTARYRKKLQRAMRDLNRELKQG